MAETLFTVLKKEHKEIKRLAQETEKDPQKYMQFAEELTTHVHAEEETFYMPFKNEEKLHEMILEGFEEHHVVDLVMKEMEKGQSGSDEWHAKFKVLTENLEHHIEEEEQKLFPAAEKLLGRTRAFELAEKYEKAEQSVMASAGRS